jgi:hypothetical protein
MQHIPSRWLAWLVPLLVISLLAPGQAAGQGLGGSPGGRAWHQAAPNDPAVPNPGPPYYLYLPLVTRAGVAAAPIIQSFTATPASIAPGQASTLAWSVTGATSLSLAPGSGAVTGSSRVVSPGATTEYTLTATNAHGSTTAKAVVTVTAPASAGSFFIVPVPDIDRPTLHPTVRVDVSGGVHVAFTPDSSGPGGSTRPAFYGYCPGHCASAAAFTIVPLGDGVEYANLALDANGHPRLLLRLAAGNMFAYQYWRCDSGCTQAAQWTSGAVGYAYTRPIGSGEPFSQFFALDPLGRPRFVYYDAGADADDPHTGAFYAYCDAGCTNPANWNETRLLDDAYATTFALALGPAGQPRLAYATYDADNVLQLLGYAECQANCGSVLNWAGTLLAATASASVTDFATFALRADGAGHPRLALYTGTGQGGSLAPNTLYYLACDAADCAQTANWSALDLGFSETHGAEGVDLALDGQDRPRIAYHAPLAAGFGLYYGWCDLGCSASGQNWHNQEVEPSEQVTQALPIPPWPGCPFPECNPPVPACTQSFWDTGVRPSLALDPAGQPRIGYDADHHQGGACGTFVDTRLTRFALFNQP